MMFDMNKAALLAVITWNLVVLWLYGFDKRMAKHGGQRVSEKTLLSAAFLMGAFGAALGMFLFHHKTRKLKFRILVPLAIVFNLAVILTLLFSHANIQ